MNIGILESGMLALMLSSSSMLPMPSDGPAKVFTRAVLQPMILLFAVNRTEVIQANDINVLEKIEKN